MKLTDAQIAHIVCEDGTQWPQRWDQVPLFVQKDFLSWARTYQQQDWSVTPERGWEIYDRQYIAFLLKHGRVIQE